MWKALVLGKNAYDMDHITILAGRQAGKQKQEKQILEQEDAERLW